ncbi:MAG: hypothetical protein AAGI37_21130 [Planctomycetota bacterium]
MALIEKIKYEGVKSTGGTPHDKTRCKAFKFDVGRRTYLQLNTYGSPDRQRKNQASQVLQFDLARAREMVKAIRDAFPQIK